MGWIYTELLLVSLAAMLSPTTLSFSVLALVLGDRPLRTGFFFYLGALVATLAIGVLAAFVIGDVAASDTSTPKTWVAIVDIVAAVVLLIYVARVLRRPPNPDRAAAMIAQMGRVASSPAIAIVAAGATLANPGGFIPLALKTISETDPSATEYVVNWVVFAFLSLLPLLVALIMLMVARAWTVQMLKRARGLLDRHVRTVAIGLVLLLAAVLLRNGIAGLTS